MGYIRVKYQRLLEELDYKYDMPSKWDQFIDNQKINHNLIFKGAKNSYTCTNCGSKFESNVKINKFAKCPYCKNTYLVKGNNLRSYVFKDNIALLDNVNNEIIVRYFELCTWYSKYNESNKFSSSVVEFARQFIDYKSNDYYDKGIVVNERVSKNQGVKAIYHFNVKNRWRLYNCYYNIFGSTIVFPYNIKEVLKGTDYQYSMIWNLVDKREYIKLDELFGIARRSDNLELLVKAKLYNLAFEADRFRNNGNFEKVFRCT